MTRRAFLRAAAAAAAATGLGCVAFVAPAPRPKPPDPCGTETGRWCGKVHHPPCFRCHPNCRCVIAEGRPTRLDYARGPSAWEHGHVLVYPNGRQRVVRIRGGRWSS